MAMAVLDLVLVLVWVGLVSIVRGAVQYRRTGASPLRFRDRPGSPQWWSRLLSAIGVLLAIAAPLAELAGLPPFATARRNRPCGSAASCWSCSGSS